MCAWFRYHPLYCEKFACGLRLRKMHICLSCVEAYFQMIFLKSFLGHLGVGGGGGDLSFSFISLIECDMFHIARH